MSSPQCAGDRFAEARAAQERGQLDEAERLYLAALAIDGGHVASLVQLGALRLQTGRHEDAIRLTEAAIGLDPGCAEAHANLATAFHLAGRHDEAVVGYEAALAADPGHAEAYYGLGLASHALERYDEAIACFERALAIDPDYAEASCGLGATLNVLKRHAQAIGHYRRALAADPDYVAALCGLAETLATMLHYDEAIEAYQRALVLQPDHVRAQIACGLVMQSADRHEEATRHFRTALALKPDDAEALIDLGNALVELGRVEEARALFERGIALDPANVRFHYAMTNATKIGSGDPCFTALEALARDVDTLSEDEQILLHFSLGKGLSDIGEHERSFHHLLRGNALKRRQLEYDEPGMLDSYRRAQAAYTSELMRGQPGRHTSNRPIFIIGMPRCGSTLVEQILASHPAVFAGGERADWRLAMIGTEHDGISGPTGRSGSGHAEARLRALAEDYVTRLERAAARAGQSACRRITDKALNNFAYVGLIKLALPHAHIIHVSRDAVDTCLSCFSKLFANDQPYTYDLAELGRYYRAYRNLIDHWRTVLPQGAMLEVRYEELVADFEPQVRRLLAHCGLEWDAACLAFHRTERAVRTSSLTQVRQPLYQTSVGRWRPKPEILRPLLDALAGL